MSSPDQPKKRGFLSTFAQSIAPMPPPEGDAAEKAKRPTTVVIALVLVTLGGALFLFNAGSRFFAVGGDQWEADAAVFRTNHAIIVTECTTSVGGIGDQVAGDAAPTAPMILNFPEATAGPQTVEPSSIVEGCRNIPAADEYLDGLASEQRYVSLAEALIGLMAIIGAFLMRNGSVPLRRVVLASVVLSLVLSLMVSAASTMFTLIASLFLVAGLVFCYIGRGGGWFLYQTASRTKH